MLIARARLIARGKTTVHDTPIDALRRAARDLGIVHTMGATTFHKVKDALVDQDDQATILIDWMPTLHRDGIRTMTIDLRNDPDPLHCLHTSRKMVANGVHPSIAARRLKVEATRAVRALIDMGAEPVGRCRTIMTELGLSADDRMLTLWPWFGLGPSGIVDGMVSWLMEGGSAREPSYGGSMHQNR